MAIGRLPAEGAEDDTAIEPPAVRAQVDDPPAPVTIERPRDLLRLLDVDDSMFEELVDGAPIDSGELDLLMRVLYELPHFRTVDIERWAQPVFEGDAVAADTEAGRGQFFWLAGQVTAVEPIEPIAETAERYDIPAYFRCSMNLAGTDRRAVVYTREIPDAWRAKLRRDETLDERATCYAMFLKFAGAASPATASAEPTEPTPPQGSDTARPVFATKRIAWHPPTPLGELGFDVGLLDDVRNGTPLSAADREAFYQMLAAAGHAAPGQLMREARRRLQRAPTDAVRVGEDGRRYWSVVPLFNDPDLQRGKLFWLEGTARRVERIEVTDPDIQARFGIDHYFQIALFTEDSVSKEGGRNPIWFCVRQLPPEMPVGAEYGYGERVRVAGFFLKTWAYRRELLPEEQSRAGAAPMQLAPLLIGREPIFLPSPTTTHPLIGPIAGGLFIAALIATWIAVWRFNRGDRQFQRNTLERNYQLEPGVSLNDLDLDVRDGPDFSRLDKGEG